MSMLRMGMVGGGAGAFIGPVHRMAARLDGGIDFVAGALASSPEKSIESGRAVSLADDRNYKSWQALLEGETKRDDRIDFVTIVTPNATHFEIARAFVEAGVSVVIDKPMVETNEQADQLAKLVTQHGVLCAVTYNYTGYPMVKQARALVQSGAIGEIRKVHVTYFQGWLAHPIEKDGQKQASWRAKGTGGAIADIGSHAENIARYVTGLEIDSLAANFNTFAPGRKVDDDANVLIKYKNGAPGATGVIIASQICIGSENDLQLRVHGTKGSLHWGQQNPNELRVTLDNEPETIHRPANAYLHPGAQHASRLPPGHPEGFIEAFANVYRNIANALRANSTDAAKHDFPDVHAGAAGVKFINTAIASSAAGGIWKAIT